MEILSIAISLVVLLYSAILHEIAHGFVADKLGDPTPRLSGRLTLNPKSHIDLYMSILLPLLLFIGTGGRFIFGGAKPVPIDPFNLKEGRKDIALVSLAGPLTNVLLAIIAGLLFKVLVFLWPSLTVAVIGAVLQIIVQVNLYLAIFNLLPIPPLDGSKVFSLLLPEREAATYMSMGQLGMIVLIILLFFPIGGFNLSNFIQSIYSLAAGLLGM